jgi:uncharacterized protein
MSVATDEGRRSRGTMPHELRRFRVHGIGFRAKTEGESEGTRSISEIDIEGYAAVTNEPYMVTDYMGEFSETIERGAFAKTLKEKDDVRLLFNHDGIPLARSKSGTLRLEEDSAGLKVNATIDNRSSLANDVIVAMERGDLDEMSFAFQALRQEWNEDYTTRVIREAKLFDVSVVTYPANPATSVKLRGVDFMLNELTDADVEEIIARHSAKNNQVPAPELLALRRRQMQTLRLT